MPKIADPLIRIAKELANLSTEDAARAVNIAKELRLLGETSARRHAPESAVTPAPTTKRRGRKPGSKNKKAKSLDETFPKDVKQDSGVAQ